MYNSVWKRPLSEMITYTGIDNTENNNIKFSPNPVKNNFIIDMSSYPSTKDYSIKIVDMLGNTVFETNTTQPLYEISTSNWTGNGNYVLQVFDSNKIRKAARKIILQ